MRKIERPGSYASSGAGCSRTYSAGCGTQAKPRKLDVNTSSVRSAGHTVREECTMIDYYELLMEQNERA